MADHSTPDMQHFQSPFSFIDQNVEILNQLQQMNPSDGEISLSNFQGLLGFFPENFLAPVPEFSGNLADDFPGFFSHENRSAVPAIEPITSSENETRKAKKRRSMETPESSFSANSSSPASGNGIRMKNSSGRGKRAKINEKDEEKQKEVVHVRAKRGQATDSHSLAERLRREKINARLKCLRSIVPGCYKTMGMAVMLDEIINYVKSLQNQVEFLSMKLTAASALHDFNSEPDIIGTAHGAKGYEAMKMQRLPSEGCEGQDSIQLCSEKDLIFGCYSSLPYNT